MALETIPNRIELLALVFKSLDRLRYPHKNQKSIIISLKIWFLGTKVKFDDEYQNVFVFEIPLFLSDIFAPPCLSFSINSEYRQRETQSVLFILRNEYLKFEDSGLFQFFFKFNNFSENVSLRCARDRNLTMIEFSYRKNIHTKSEQRFCQTVSQWRTSSKSVKIEPTGRSLNIWIWIYEVRFPIPLVLIKFFCQTTKLSENGKVEVRKY